MSSDSFIFSPLWGEEKGEGKIECLLSLTPTLSQREK